MSTTLTTTSKKISFQDVIDSVSRDSVGKADYITPVKNLHIDQDGSYAFKNLGSVQGPRLRDIPFAATDWAESQLMTKLGMPAQYFRKAKTADPELFAQHFNYWASRTDGEMMLRSKVHDGANHGLIRGAVSTIYSRLDNDFVIEVLRQILSGNQDDFEICSYHLDSGRFHLRIAFLDATKTLGVLPNGLPDYNKIGQDIVNSEVAMAAFNLQSMLWREICSNGMRGWDSDGEAFVQRHVHIKPHEFQNRVVKAMTDSFVSGHNFMEAFERTQAQKLDNPFSVIKKIAKQNKYSREFADTLQENFEGESTAYGVVNALTRSARELPNARRLEVEKDAGHLVKLPVSRWANLDAIDAEFEEVS